LCDIYHILLTSYRAKATQDFLQNTDPDFISAEDSRMLTTLTALEPLVLFSLGHLARTCVWGAWWTVCKLTWIEKAI